MKRRRDKRGVSIVIGYVILVAVVVAMSFLVYRWMRTYVPEEELKCPDDVSIRIESVKCVDTCVDESCGDTYPQIETVVKNTGLFDIDGYLIRGENEAGVLIEVSKGNYIFTSTKIPNFKIYVTFGENSDQEPQEISSIEITPLRKQINEKTGDPETVICTDSVVKRTIDGSCGIVTGTNFNEQEPEEN